MVCSSALGTEQFIIYPVHHHLDALVRNPALGWFWGCEQPAPPLPSLAAVVGVFPLLYSEIFTRLARTSLSQKPHLHSQMVFGRSQSLARVTGELANLAAFRNQAANVEQNQHKIKKVLIY